MLRYDNRPDGIRVAIDSMAALLPLIYTTYMKQKLMELKPIYRLHG
jgi:hypothetical protein